MISRLFQVFFRNWMQNFDFCCTFHLLHLGCRGMTISNRTHIFGGWWRRYHSCLDALGLVNCYRMRLINLDLDLVPDVSMFEKSSADKTCPGPSRKGRRVLAEACRLSTLQSSVWDHAWTECPSVHTSVRGKKESVRTSAEFL
jgi:hypothetical protein